jgi:hypothetical protein
LAAATYYPNVIGEEPMEVVDSLIWTEKREYLEMVLRKSIEISSKALQPYMALILFT